MPSTLLLPLQYTRQNAVSLDVDQVFSTTLARTNYLTSPRRYAGQIVADLEEDRIYMLSAARDTWLVVPSTYAQLIDFATVDLPSLNVPLGLALQNAAALPWSPANTYDDGTIGAELNYLDASVITLEGTNGQVVVTPTTETLVTLSLPQSVDTTSDPQFRDLTVRKLRGSGNSPSVLAWGAGAGADSTPTTGTIAGTDLFFTLTVQPSATPAANTLIANVLWAEGAGAFTGAPTCIIVPMNRAAAGIQGNSVSYVSAVGGVNGVQLTSGLTTALTAGTTYLFGVFVLGR